MLRPKMQGNRAGALKSPATCLNFSLQSFMLCDQTTSKIGRDRIDAVETTSGIQHDHNPKYGRAKQQNICHTFISLRQEKAHKESNVQINDKNYIPRVLNQSISAE
jgi:hypothetical protein